MSASTVDRTLIALADPTRRGVIDLLRAGPLRAGELASALQMQKPAMTRHLRLLRESGLVYEDGLREDARVRVYRLRRAPFSALRKWLDEVEAARRLQGACRAHTWTARAAQGVMRCSHEAQS